MQLVENWKTILLKSWSVRFMAVAGICAYLMNYTDLLSFLPRWAQVAIVLSGIYFRVVDQGLGSSKKEEADDDAPIGI